MNARTPLVDPWAAVPGIVAIAVMVSLKMTVYPDAFASVRTIVVAGFGPLVLVGISQYVLARCTDPGRGGGV